MSYRLITKATLTIVSAAAQTLTREVEVRAYPAPKRAAVGLINVDGADVSYQRTGGKGRGPADKQYAYFPFGAESAYVELTAAEATALVGGRATIIRVVAPVEQAPVEQAPAAPVEQPAAEAPAPTLTRKQRAALKRAEQAA